MLPIGSRVVVVHGRSLLFALSATLFSPDSLRSCEMSAGVEPASYAIAVLERSRFAGQVAKDALGHVLRQMNITMDLPQGR